jgi:hypothetical protein
MAQRKMVDLLIEETSGVDHPAHLHEGWLVMKAAAPTEVWRVLDDIGQTNPQETGMSDVEKADLLARIADVEAENAALRKAAATSDATPTGDDEVLKSLPEPARAAFEQMQKQAEDAIKTATEANETLRKEREQRADDEAIAMVKSLASLSVLDADKVGPALRKMRETDPEVAAEIEKALRAANAQTESADIFKSLGSSASAASGSAYDDLMTKAASLQSVDASLTKAQAFAKAVEANPDLYTQYQAERSAKVG